MKLAIFLVFLNLFLIASNTVVPHDKEYYKFKKDNVEIIFPEEHIDFVKHTANKQTQIHQKYEYLYNWKLDETLYVGLMSSYNQIANGFSTQWPNNRQINYVGGVQLIDSFAATSWLDTLLYHETAHNYQLNVKDNVISNSLHSVLGNGSFSFVFPLWIVPNMFENSFMLEGNAVLNESWHGNGGRLYSGRYKAQTILQAAAGKIKPAEVYNKKIAFPYGDIYYIQGGFYNLYLAKKYGMDNVNRYFKYYSQSYLWPFYTNYSMKQAIGADFEGSLKDFEIEYADMAKNLILASGKPIATSQFFTSLSNNFDEIYFLINENGARAPELIVINKKTKEVDKKRDSFLSGKVIKVDGNYYTQTSNHTSTTKITQGLFDSNAIIKEDTKSKMVQGYLSDGKKVYFDVASSFSQAQLYVGDKFYAQVNSSVIVDKNDNLYYFIQDAKTRTLYKNKIPLYFYEGFYGIVSDVDSSGGVYFIANSENGSTLYRYKDGEVKRMSNADNIIEARLINDDEVLLAAINDKEYYYLINSLTSIDEQPFVTRLYFENKPFYANNINKKEYEDIDLSNPYNSLLDMHYSGANISLGYGYSSYLGSYVDGNAEIVFSDPLAQNKFSLFGIKDTYSIDIAGLSYMNTQYLLQYGITTYKVIDINPNYLQDHPYTIRDYGFVLKTLLPFYKQERYEGIVSMNYFEDYNDKNRNPVNTMVTLKESEHYGRSIYLNYLNSLSLYASFEDDNKVYGAKYSFMHDMPYEIYFKFNAKYSNSNSKNKGVVFSSTESEDDYSRFYMPNLEYSYYLKNAGYVDVALSKVINFSSYWFTFPISLQREAIYAKYKRYELTSISDNRYSVNESKLGITFSTVFFNNGEVPISVEYMYNDAKFIKNNQNIRIKIDVNF